MLPAPRGPRVGELRVDQQPPNKHDDMPSHMPRELVSEESDLVLGLGEDREMGCVGVNQASVQLSRQTGQLVHRPWGPERIGGGGGAARRAAETKG